jgi:uncharacterized protein
VRVALDSSVLIAAVLTTRGVCASLLTTVIEHHDLVLSDFILEEVARKLRGKFRLDESRVELVVAELRSIANLVVPAPLPESDCRDPADIPILGTAVDGHVSLLISVDKDLLALGEFRGIPIVKPGEFWRRMAGV